MKVPSFPDSVSHSPLTDREDRSDSLIGADLNDQPHAKRRKVLGFSDSLVRHSSPPSTDWFSTFPVSSPDQKVHCLTQAFARIGITIPNLVYTHPRLTVLSHTLDAELLLLTERDYLPISPLLKLPKRAFILFCSRDYTHCVSVHACSPDLLLKLQGDVFVTSHWPFQGQFCDIRLAGKRGGNTKGQNKPRRRSGGRRSGQQKNNDFFEKEDRIQRFNPLDRQTVRFTKIIDFANIVTSTTTATFRSYAFSLDQVSDQAELAGVFDQYRIDRVDCRFVPAVTETLTSTALIGKVYSVIDYDDANSFTSTTDPLDYSNCMVWEPTDPIQITLVPHLAIAAFGSGVFSSYANSKPRWIDCASPTVQHFGVKLAIGVLNTATTYTVQFRYHLTFRMSH